ncbi:hypothetical protein ACLBYE_19545, partial [Methylobacterium sp. A52T]
TFVRPPPPPGGPPPPGPPPPGGAPATATRDLPGPDGAVVPAAQLQAASLAALGDLFAVVARGQGDIPD